MGRKNDTSDGFDGEGFSFRSSDGTVIQGVRWIPDKKDIKCVLIINHGMAEHIRRYGHFASYLNKRGIAAYGEDHRGHGRTAGDQEDLGYFAEKKGWIRVLEDIRTLHLLVQKENPRVPVVMLGHSMGSFLTRHYLTLHGNDLSCAVLSGTGFTPNIAAQIGGVIARYEVGRLGGRHRSTLLDRMSFGQFNKSFRKEGDTGFEWLSRDRMQVRLYKQDPYCGFICTSAHFRDLFEGLSVINGRKAFQDTPDSLPLLLISGDKDPLGKNGRGVKKVFCLYKKYGTRNITLQFISEGRHECLNEINREEVFSFITDWMEQVVIKQAQ